MRYMKGFVKAGQLAQNLKWVNAKRHNYKDTHLHTNRKHGVFTRITLPQTPSRREMRLNVKRILEIPSARTQGT
jgi:hypothetical protein